MPSWRIPEGIGPDKANDGAVPSALDGYIYKSKNLTN